MIALARPLRHRALPRLLRRLRRDRSGLAYLEFALALPSVLGISCYGIELSNLGLANLRVSQIALNLADNASRVGLMSNLSVEQLREVDINDVLQAARLQGAKMKIGTYGRITVSSLENNSGVQRIHWQRCFGLAKGAGFDSSYGITATSNVSSGTTYDPTAGVNTQGSPDNSATHPGSLAVGAAGKPLVGMGDDPLQPVQAPPNAGVIFVEVNYTYQPVFSQAWLPGGSTKIHYIASFIVRDNRDFSQIYNPSPAVTRSTCDKYTA